MGQSQEDDAHIRELLQETVRRYVNAEARIVGVRELPITPGASGAAVGRYEVRFRTDTEREAVTQLVIKEAGPVERQTVAHLNAQRQANVPFSYTLDATRAGRAALCLQDLGSVTRPTSRESISPAALQQEADGLAAIHVANWGQGARLPWLPHTDRAYFEDMIEHTFWRPHWERIIHDPAFQAEFGSELPRIEAAATTIVADMAALYAEGDSLTLVHTDINPSNVLLYQGGIYFIDWAAAHYGPCYLDIPHHFFNPALAEHYHTALAKRGIVIPPAIFSERFRATARYTALRYMWWTFEAWRDDPADAAWVRHYFAMVLS